MRKRFLKLTRKALAYTTVSLIRSGQLTIDRERQRAHSRTLHAIGKLRSASQPIPKELETKLARFADVHHFYVPLPDIEGGGVIVATLPGENPYDMGDRANWELIMGKGWGWLSPFRSLRRWMGDEIFNWPLAPAVEARLRAEAKRIHGSSADG